MKKIYITALPIRIWHWVNALSIITLCLTGIQIRFPDYFHLFGDYRNAIALHNAAGWMVSGVFLLFLWYYGVTTRTLMKLYVPDAHDLKHGLMKQFQFYALAYFKGSHNPHTPSEDRKFNAIQKASYCGLMLFLTPIIIVTGILLLQISPMREWVLMIGGLKVIISVHFLVGCCFGAFLFVHLYLATLGHTFWAHFEQMWTGWEEVPDEEHH